MTELGDVVELIENLPDRQLWAGIQGTIVYCHGETAYEVEFTNDQGETLAWLTVKPTQFIVVWQARTQQWVSPAQQTAALVEQLAPDLAKEVLDFARFLKGRYSSFVTT
jgi:hypothetical protein